MTNGEKTVILVRAQALSTRLRVLLALSRRVRTPAWRLHDAMYDVHWEAQRLQSSCNRALGTRQR